MVVEVWVQVPLKSAHDTCDDVISNDLNDSSETSLHSPESHDTWHWYLAVCCL